MENDDNNNSIVVEPVEANLFAHPEVPEWETPLNFHQLGIWLKPHQSTGVRWMQDREQPNASYVRGGVLNDEAGLGKTLMTLTMIKASLEFPLESDELWRRPTLIICPASLIKVWEDEIRTKFPKDAFRVFKYYGPQRHEDDLDGLMQESDIIITSYGTVVKEWESKKDKSSMATTGVDAPAISDFKHDSIFHKLFGRIVLDEAHNIKNPSSKRSIAVQQLLSKRFWCITATSIMNELDDLFALFSFMTIKPFANDHYEWTQKIANPITVNSTSGFKILHNYTIPITLRRTKAVLNLPQIFYHKQAITLSELEMEFYASLFYYSRERVKKMVEFMEFLKKQLKGRKRKRGHDDDGDDSDAHLYRSARANVWLATLRLRQACVSPALAINGVKRLRGFIPNEDQEDEDYARERLQSMPTTNQVVRAIQGLRSLTLRDDCTLCMDEKSDIAAKPCNHVACQSCWDRVLSKGSSRCPWCATPIEEIVVIEQRIEQLEEEQATISSLERQASEHNETEVQVMNIIPSKIAWVINHIQTHDEKCLIVSQWTTALDIVETLLRSRMPETQFCRLDGKIPPQKRHEIISEFQTNPDIRICLVSLTSSSEGVTMTGATHVYKVDLWWNEAREYQMDNRVHRIGQYRDVHIYTLYIPGTIEDNMIEMRESKKLIADASIGIIDTAIHPLPFVNKVKLLFKLSDEDENIKMSLKSLQDIIQSDDDDPNPDESESLLSWLPTFE